MVASTMPDDRHLQRVEHADQQRAAVGVGGRIVGDQRLADRNAGDAAEEAEAGGDVPGREVAVVLPIRYQAIGNTMPTMTTCQTMLRSAVRPGQAQAPPRRGAGSHRAQRGGGRHCTVPGMHPVAQRIGGAYCRPPLVQRLLMPRGTPIGVMLRSQISPKLPTCLITL